LLTKQLIETVPVNFTSSVTWQVAT